jgi:hypothetical protein
MAVWELEHAFKVVFAINCLGGRTGKTALSALRGEREGPGAREPSAHGLDPWGREGEVGEAANRLGGPPLPYPPAWREGKLRLCAEPLKN